MNGLKISILIIGYLSCLISGYGDPEDKELGYIGISFARTGDSNGLTVNYLASGSPADEAGLKVGDIIVKINGIATNELENTDTSHIINGKIGSTVQLTVRHSDKTEDVLSIRLKTLIDTFRKAADGADPRAQYSVGLSYQIGATTAQDPYLAEKWYKKAAEQGYAPAQINLGRMYKYGAGIPKNMVLAAGWFFKGAYQGDIIAERELAICYLKAEGLPKDDSKAFYWFDAAAVHNDSKSQEYLGWCYLKGIGVHQNDQEAFNWYYKSAKLNNLHAEWTLARMYALGKGVKQNWGEALSWYKKAQAGLPQDQDLNHEMLLFSFALLLSHYGSVSQGDLSSIFQPLHHQIVLFSGMLVIISISGGITLFYLAFKTPPSLPNLLTAIGWIGFYFECQFLFVAIISQLGVLLSTEMAAVIVLMSASLPVIVASLGSYRNMIWNRPQLTVRQIFINLTLSGLAIIIIQYVYGILYSLITGLAVPMQSSIVPLIQDGHHFSLLTYATISLLTPIAEEILFRKYLFDALTKYLSEYLVVIVSALVFALVHFELAFVLPLFGVGVVLGVLRVRGKSIHLPIIVHVINNALWLILISQS